VPEKWSCRESNPHQLPGKTGHDQRISSGSWRLVASHYLRLRERCGPRPLKPVIRQETLLLGVDVQLLQHVLGVVAVETRRASARHPTVRVAGRLMLLDHTCSSNPLFERLQCFSAICPSRVERLEQMVTPDTRRTLCFSSIQVSCASSDAVQGQFLTTAIGPHGPDMGRPLRR
jgi:hypothetical protein